MPEAAVQALPIVRGAAAARASLLQRLPLEETPISPTMAGTLRRVLGRDERGRDLRPEEAVRRIIAAVRGEGDAALRRFAEAIEGSAPAEWLVSDAEMRAARDAVDPETLQALQLAAEQVRRFHERQMAHAVRSFLEDGQGQRVRPLRRVGLYVPGVAVVYPSTVLHTAIPARVAGVEDVCIASPADSTGAVSPLKLVAAEIAGVRTVYKVGGAQAIAALAYGTESIPAVDKIFGPGNIFVTLAKRQVFGDVGIDALYGPTETLIVADHSADPELCSADLLAQAEHDELACPILITPSEQLAEAVARIVPERARTMERGAIALAAFQNRGGIVLAEDVETALTLADEFAPEHMALQVEAAERRAERIANAGGLFIGEASPEALADYAAGPSHVMPTGGSARYASPLTVNDFLKITTLVHVSENTLREIGPIAERIAEAEGLGGHARSLAIRRRDR